jgi:two-component system catabolic regulation response regulator CreB/two-component system response regulator ChvI
MAISTGYQTISVPPLLTTKNDLKRILVVDDEPDTCLVLKNVLEEDRFLVDSFNDPFLALKNFRVNVYDLLLLDIKMPTMNGYELFIRIRKIDGKVKVCFLTALSEYQDYLGFKKNLSPDVVERCVIAKPIDNGSLLDRINGIIMT